MPLYHMAFCLAAVEHDPTLEFDSKVKFVVEKSMQLWRNKYLKNGFISRVPGWYVSYLHSSPPLFSSSSPFSSFTQYNRIYLGCLQTGISLTILYLQWDETRPRRTSHTLYLAYCVLLHFLFFFFPFSFFPSSSLLLFFSIFFV